MAVKWYLPFVICIVLNDVLNLMFADFLRCNQLYELNICRKDKLSQFDGKFPKILIYILFLFAI